jgi:hypothetical protein
MNQNAKRYARLPLALALGAMCLGGATVASAETTNSIYGNFRWSVNYVDQGTPNVDNIQADDNQSRLGLRGEVKGSDLTAFYHWETGLSSDGASAFDARLYYAGVKGGFGALTVGRHSPAYKVGGTSVNPFGDTGVATVNGVYGPTGAAFGLSALTNGFANNTIAYTSPKLGPVTLNAAIYIDDTTEDDHNYAAGVAYAGGPITAGFQYYDARNKMTAAVPATTARVQTFDQLGNAIGFTNVTTAAVAAQNLGPWANAADLKAYRAHGSFKTGPLTLGASIEMLDPNANNVEETMYYFLSATFAVTPELRLAASVGLRDYDGPDAHAGAASDGLGINIGAFYNVLPNTTVYALGSLVDFDRDGVDDTTVISAGLIYNFNMKL